MAAKKRKRRKKEGAFKYSPFFAPFAPLCGKNALVFLFEVEVHLSGRNAAGAITVAHVPAVQPYKPADDEAEFDDQADHGFRLLVSFGNDESRPP
jgi:hypothetical protein